MVGGNISSEKIDLLIYGPSKQIVDNGFSDQFVLHSFETIADLERLTPAAAEKIRGAAVTYNSVRGDARTLARFPKLEIVSAFGVGYDHVDANYAAQHNIVVTNTPDVLTDDVADLGMALLLAVARRLVVGDRHVRNGLWLKGGLPLASKVGGATLGILGLGRIGLAIARRAEAFGMTIVYHGPRAKADAPYRYYGDLAAMARESDYLMVSCPGGAQTRHLVNAEVLAALGPEGVVINVARGSVIDEEAMVKLLFEGKLGGAGLDVFADEPRVPEALFALDTVVLQPHVGSATHATRAAMGQLVVDNLTAHFAGRPLLTQVR
jgi:lactate dehydrogenase-like 2-hydroxyacid dehydrogenase